MLEIKLSDRNTQTRWEKNATVRSRPRRLLEQFQTDTGFYYPTSRQPLAIHPAIEKLGEEAKRYILLQSLYKYSSDIAYIETQVVNRITLYIAHDGLEITFDPEWRRDALTIVIDESYHAYVALDSLIQIQNHTQIKPLDLGNTVSLELAIDWFKKELGEESHKIMELICVCIAENTLTKEIAAMMDRKETHRYFQHILRDHLTDEARHSSFFLAVLKHLWENLDETRRYEIGTRLPQFITQYLDNSLQRAFDVTILRALGLAEECLEVIIEDTYTNPEFSATHPMIKNIMSLLHNAGVLKHGPTKSAFSKYNWIELGILNQ